MKIGYARVSTTEQNLSLQTDALEQAGCEKVFYDQISGTKTSHRDLMKHLLIFDRGMFWWFGDWIAWPFPETFDRIRQFA